MSKQSPLWWHGFFISATIAGAGILTSVSLRDCRTEAGRPADGFAYIANPVAGDGPRADFATTSFRSHRRGKNVGASDADVPDSAQSKRILFSRCMERRLYGLPCHAGTIAFCRRQHMGFAGR